MKIHLVRSFRIEMAHALPGYNGACRNIHGHTYRLVVDVKGEPISDLHNPHYGMVMDLKDLKNVVQDSILEYFDHHLVLREDQRTMISDPTLQVRWVSYQPTCENMLIDFVERLKGEFPKGVELFAVQLFETADSAARWLSAEN